MRVVLTSRRIVSSIVIFAVFPFAHLFNDAGDFALEVDKGAVGIDIKV